MTDQPAHDIDDAPDELRAAADQPGDQPWEWRIALAGAMPRPRTAFHAYDMWHRAACDPAYGLVQTARPKGPGDRECFTCAIAVSVYPAGRPDRELAP